MTSAMLSDLAPDTGFEPLSDEARALVEEHLPLVRQVVAGVAAHYPRHTDREELAQAAALGLVEAARRFDGSRSVPFGRWATLRMRGAVVDAVRGLDFAPRSLRSAARTAQTTQERLSGELGRPATEEETASAIGMTVEELGELRGRVHSSMVMSLDAPAGTGDEGARESVGASIIDAAQLEPADVLLQRERSAYLRDAVDCLPERLRLVVRGYFLEGRTSSEIAEELGVSESRVSQLRSQGLRLMRAGLEAQYEEGGQMAAPAGAEQAAYARALADRSTFAERFSQGQARRR